MYRDICLIYEDSCLCIEGFEEKRLFLDECVFKASISRNLIAWVMIIFKMYSGTNGLVFLLIGDPVRASQELGQQASFGGYVKPSLDKFSGQQRNRTVFLCTDSRLAEQNGSLTRN